ncbi:glycosyltransferase family 2 protein [bacterium]
MQYKNKLAVIVPTRNRVFELKRLLNSISSQSCKPDQIIIIDNSAQSNEKIFTNYNNMPIVYKFVDVNSSAKSRNIGALLVKDDIGLISFFDDDIVLEQDAFKNMMDFWEQADDATAGCGFNIIDNKKPNWFSVVFVKSIFYMATTKRGKVLKSVFNNSYAPAEKTGQTEWLSSCAQVWRKGIFNQFLFDEWFEEYSFLEDIEQSYRISRKYKVYVLKEAKVRHLTNKSQNDNFARGRMEIRNRLYIAKKLSSLSPALAVWASFGQGVIHLIKSIFKLKPGLFTRAIGNWTAIIEFLKTGGSSANF